MYGPSPWNACWKWPSGHWTTSGSVMPGFRGWSVWDSDEWKSCWRKLSAAKKPRTMPFQCACQVLLRMFPIDMYTGQYWLWPVAMETVVLSLPSIIGTNMDPCVSGSWVMMSCVDYLWVIPARVKYIQTACFQTQLPDMKLWKWWLLSASYSWNGEQSNSPSKSGLVSILWMSSLGLQNQTSNSSSIHGNLSLLGISPSYFTMKLSHGTSPMGVESIML